jgi:hypothetical protein
VRKLELQTFHPKLMIYWFAPAIDEFDSPHQP